MKKSLVYTLFGVLLILVVGQFIYTTTSKQKIYYVDLQKVYAEFDLKKEHEVSLTNFTNDSNMELDSLALAMNQLKYKIEDERIESDIYLYDQLGAVYMAKEENILREQSRMAEEFDSQIWQQLNQYINDYGSEKNCDFIVGGNGDGSIMYAKTSKDVTDEVIIYVNQKYAGN